MIQADIKDCVLIDSDLTDDFRPANEENFRELFRFYAGPAGSNIRESFDMNVVSPKWLDLATRKVGLIDGRHLLIMARFSYSDVCAFVESYAAECSAPTWTEVACKLARIAHWEFEDYPDY